MNDGMNVTIGFPLKDRLRTACLSFGIVHRGARAAA